MKFGSLFSGIGGFDLGFERAGMECAWQCEIDTSCQKLLSQKFGVKLYDDVRTITAANTEPVDLICGGFPCQDVSIAGKRAGFAGERSGLWAEFARIIDELKPGWVVIENVPGLLSSNQGRDFQTVLDQMVESGYGVCWRVLDAQYFGVAQRRRRVFIVGSLGSGRSAEVLFEREGVRWNPPARGKTGEGIAGSVEEGAGTLGFDLAQITSKLNYSNPKPGDPQPPINTFAQGMVAYENRPQDSRVKELGDVMQTLDARMGEGGGNVPLVMATGQAGAEVVSDGSPSLTANHEQPIVTIANWQSGGGKMDDDKAASLRSGAEVNYQFAHINQGVRRLTPTECERLQGFPDGWTAWQSDSTRYKQLGNAVAVPVAEWIGKRINQ